MASAKVTMYPSGKTIDLLDPDPGMIDIEDIAHALSILPRWNGATRFPYTVGQHSLWCYKYVPGLELGYQALMHDAAEAYVNDLWWPLKRNLPKYSLIEGQLWHYIAEKFGLPEFLDQRVHDVDSNARVIEQIVLRGPKLVVSNEIRYQHYSKTKKEFLATYTLLQQKLNLKTA